MPGLFDGLLVMFSVEGIFIYAGAAESKKLPKVGPVKMSPHPSSLEGRPLCCAGMGNTMGINTLAE